MVLQGGLPCVLGGGTAGCLLRVLRASPGLQPCLCWSRPSSQQLHFTHVLHKASAGRWPRGGRTAPDGTGLAAIFQKSFRSRGKNALSSPGDTGLRIWTRAWKLELWGPRSIMSGHPTGHWATGPAHHLSSMAMASAPHGTGALGRKPGGTLKAGKSCRSEPGLLWELPVPCSCQRCSSVC